MKKTFSILLTIIFSFNMYGQTDVDYVEIINKSILKAKEMSLYSNEVNWDSLSNIIIEQAISQSLELFHNLNPI